LVVIWYARSAKVLWHADYSPDHEKNEGLYQRIVTDSVKTLYQKTHCFGLGHNPKIHLASNGKAINNW
jgi:hypothetical protein